MLNLLLKKKHKHPKIYNKTKKKPRKSAQKGKKKKTRKKKKRLKYKRITRLEKEYMKAQIEDMKIRELTTTI